MEQVVYVDLYFLINFSMDLLVFFLTCRLLSYPFYFGRSVVASVFGGIYASAALILGVYGFFGAVLDIAACVVMSFIAHKKRGECRSVFSFALVYTAVSIVLGGAMTALFSLFNRIGLGKLLGWGERRGIGLAVRAPCGYQRMYIHCCRADIQEKRGSQILHSPPFL